MSVRWVVRGLDYSTSDEKTPVRVSERSSQDKMNAEKQWERDRFKVELELGEGVEEVRCSKKGLEGSSGPRKEEFSLETIHIASLLFQRRKTRQTTPTTAAFETIGNMREV